MAQLLSIAMRTPSQLLAWWRRQQHDWSVSGQVHIQSIRTAAGPRTSVSIDHRIPSEADPSGGWRITTRAQLLPKAHFLRHARDKVNAASDERGRRIYCIDLGSQEVLTALSYHLDDAGSLPLLITAIALRSDSEAPSALFDQSRAAALLTKQYLHVISADTGRGDFVDIDHGNPRETQDLEDIGFTRAPKVKGYRPAGALWRQRPI